MNLNHLKELQRFDPVLDVLVLASGEESRVSRIFMILFSMLPTD